MSMVHNWPLFPYQAQLCHIQTNQQTLVLPVGKILNCALYLLVSSSVKVFPAYGLSSIVRILPRVQTQTPGLPVH